jgi:predicted acetyltransferase
VTGEVRRCSADDLAQIVLIRQEAFRTETREADWLEGGWVLAEDGQVTAITQVEWAGQYFGGRVVPSALIRSVAVAAIARGKGRGTRLLQEVLRQLRDDGLYLSALYPTDLSVYRRVGYEVAGSRMRYRQSIDTLPRRSDVDVEPMTVATMSEVRDCYSRFAAESNGLLDRPQTWWEKTESAISENRMCGCLVRSRGQVGGYLFYKQRRDDAGADDGPLSALGLKFSLDCRDFVWTDIGAAQSLLAFAAASRGLGTDLHWFGPFPDPISVLQNTQDARRIEWTELWMSRLLDVTKSLIARGYTSSLSGSVELNVTDETLSDNDGAIRIEFIDGSAHIDSVGTATAQVDVGTFASMYTGWLPARRAATIGSLKNATEHEVDLLDVAFAGPSPWMMDIF